VADYAAMTRLMAPFATYLAVNISSPNTPGLRALQDEAALTALLDAVLEARGTSGPQVFLKVAPDLEPADIDAIARIAIDKGLGALIVSNTTISRPPLKSPHAGETGGLSGAPLRALAQQRLADFRKATGGALPLIGVGGIGSAEDAWARIRAGASLVQLYSAMVYEGPGIARRITRRLEELMRHDGFKSIAEAVGTG
jgi:dihydroorotate dehydrogenase